MRLGPQNSISDPQVCFGRVHAVQDFRCPLVTAISWARQFPEMLDALGEVSDYSKTKGARMCTEIPTHIYMWTGRCR